MKLIETLIQLFKTSFRNNAARPATLAPLLIKSDLESMISECRAAYPEMTVQITKGPNNYSCTVIDLKILKQDLNSSELSHRQLECNILNKEILFEFISRIRIENDIYISNSDQRKTLFQSYANEMQKIKIIDDYQRCEIVAGAYKDIHHLLTDYPAALFIMENRTDSGKKYFEFINPLKKTIQEPSLEYARYISQYLPKAEIISNIVTKEYKHCHKLKL